MNVTTLARCHYHVPDAAHHASDATQSRDPWTPEQQRITGVARSAIPIVLRSIRGTP